MGENYEEQAGGDLKGFKSTQYLQDDERCRLLRRPYETALFKGEFLADAIRGKVRFSQD